METSCNEHFTTQTPIWQRRMLQSSQQCLTMLLIIIHFCRYIYHLMRLPQTVFLWSSGQSSWLQIQRSRFDYRHYQSFWEVVSLEWGPLSLVSTNGELLERKSSCSSLESREYGRWDPSCWPRGTLCPPKLALTLPTSGSHSVGIVRLRTQAMEFRLVF
jgi:hypothetical protein